MPFNPEVGYSLALGGGSMVENVYGWRCVHFSFAVPGALISLLLCCIGDSRHDKPMLEEFTIDNNVGEVAISYSNSTLYSIFSHP